MKRKRPTRQHPKSKVKRANREVLELVGAINRFNSTVLVTLVAIADVAFKKAHEPDVQVP